MGHYYLPAGLSADGEPVRLAPSSFWHLPKQSNFQLFQKITLEEVIYSAQGLPGKVFESRKPVWVTDINEILVPKRARAAARSGIRSGFAFPVLAGEEVLAIAEFFSEQEREPDSALLEIIGNIESQICRVAERERAEAALRQSQHQLAEAQRLAHIGNWEWDLHTNRLSWSEEMCRIYGIDPAKFDGTYETFVERIHPGDRDQTLKVIEEASRARAAFEMEHRIIRPDGEIRHISGRGALVFDENNESIRMFGTGQDITQQKVLDQALKESRDLLKNLFEASPNGTLLADSDGRIVQLNRQVELMFGRKHEALIGQPIEVLLPDRYRELHQQRRQAYALDAHPHSMGAGLELYGLRPDGTEFPVDVLLSPLQTQSGVSVIAVISDITRRKQAAEMMRRSEAYFRSLIENAADVITILDEQGQIRYTSPSTERMLGLSAEELAGRSFLDFIHPEDAVAFLSAIDPAPGSGAKKALSYRLKFEDGSWRFMEATYKDLTADPVVAGIVVNSRDITEQRQAEEALRQSEIRFRTIFEGAAQGMAVVDLNRRILMSNIRLQEILGYTADELRGMDKLEYTYPADRLITLDLFQGLISGRRDHDKIEKRYVRKDGRVIWCELSMSLIRDAQNGPRFAITMVQDVSDEKQMQAELVEVKHRLLASRELERTRLAQEIHDVPIQELYAILFQLDDIKDYLTQPDRLIGWKQEQAEALRNVINTLRSICGELRSPTLVPFGLEGAIREHVDAYQQKYPDIQVELDLMPDSQQLPEAVRLNLFRIYQQALNNVVRHSQAQHVKVSFRFDDESILLEIEDDGHGFEVPKRWIGLAREGHLGLVGSAERAEMIGGSFKVISKPGKGTIIRVEVLRNQKFDFVMG